MAKRPSGIELTEKPVVFDFPSALRSQAVVRLSLASVSIAAWLVTTHLLGISRMAVVALGCVHIVYSLVMLAVARLPRRYLHLWIGYLTAVLDPLILTGWAAVMGRAGVLVAPLYVFSAIGYGLRTGDKGMMGLSQTVSLLGLGLLPLFAPYWGDHLLLWGSCLLSILAIPSYVGVLMDQLHQAIRYAESESRAKSDLLARTSHELRTPLGGISNAAELLLTDPDPDRRKTLAQTILTLSGHLLADINDLLDQSKLSLGKVEMAASAMSLRQQVDVVRASLESNASARGLALVCNVDPDLAEHVLGDAHWLSRVLINLCGNAVKFTRFGSVRLDISLLQRTESDYLIRFSVKDTGMGIPRQQQERIFDPFVQLESSERARAAGVGLGLAICKQAVELMGGVLCVRSEPDVGSTFWFDLRMPRASAAAAPADDPESVLPVPQQAQQRLLVVDDNETNRYLLQELLRRDGHEVTTAASGEQALDILGAGARFDLLLLDYNLGGMDGSMLLKTYRAGTVRPAPAYFLTADATLVTAAKLSETGALGVLTKPVRLRELRQAIDAACGQGEPPAAIAAQRQSVDPHARQAGAASAGAAHLRPVPVVFIDLAVIDRLRQIGTRQVFLKELLDRAAVDIEVNTTRILDALDEGDLQAARDAGHALKGVCMETGAMRLMNMALGVMRTEDAYLLENRSRIAAELRDTSARTREALQSIVADTMRQAAGF